MNRHNLQFPADWRLEASTGHGASASQLFAGPLVSRRGGLPAAQRVGRLASRTSGIQPLRALRVC